MNKAEKLKNVEAFGKTMDKEKEGQNTFQRQGNKVNKPVPSIATNLATVDHEIFGCGGFPRGRIIEVYGPESAGKTALSLHTVGQCQKAGGVGALVDAEHALSPTFASTLGVDMDELIISQPDCGEEALTIVEGLVDAGVDIIVVDSVTALVPRAEIEGDMGDSHMGLQARLMSQAMRKLCGKVSKSGCTVIFINQIREKVGLVFGSPEVTTGGRALKFYSSLRVEVRRVAGSKGGVLKEGDEIVGHKMNVKCVKNKVAMPFKEGTVDLYYHSGFDMDGDQVAYAQKIGVLSGAAWLTIKDDTEKYRKEDLTTGPGYAKLNEAVKKFHNDFQKSLEKAHEEAS